MDSQHADIKDGPNPFRDIEGWSTYSTIVESCPSCFVTAGSRITPRDSNENCTCTNSSSIAPRDAPENGDPVQSDISSISPRDSPESGAPTGSETTNISPIDLLIEGRNPEQPGTPNTSLISPLHKRGMLIPSAVECYGILPPWPLSAPPSEPPVELTRLYHNIRNLCAADSNAPAGNMGCTCEGKALHCPRGTSWEFQQLADYCLEQCDCGIGSFSKYLDDAAELAGATINSDVLPWSALTAGDGPNPFQDVLSGVMPIVDSNTGTGPVPGQDSCPGTCTSVTRQCSYRETCSCYAPRVDIIFWNSGNCGPARKSIASLTAANAASGMGGRKAKRQEDLTSLNGTAAAPALGSSATADTRMPSSSNGTYGTTNSTIDWNSFPAPCHESCVSYACANSTDGIVYEPIENWLILWVLILSHFMEASALEN